MQHGEGKQPPPTNTSRMHGVFRDRGVSACFDVFCVFALGSAGAKDNRSVLSMEKSRDSLKH